MAKKEKVEEQNVKDIDPAKLTKLLIDSFNQTDKEKIAWNLASDEDNPTDVKEFISTGNLLLDYVISNRKGGGVPVGKLTEISGEEASGKSLLCSHLIKECQRRGGLAIYIDTENAANPAFMEQIGVDISKLVYLQPGTVEEVGEAIEKAIIMARTKAPNRLVLIIWDSVAGTPTKAEVEGTHEINMNVALEKARILGLMMKKITQTLGKERICLVFTNQLKTKIGVMYGDPMTTPGGKAIPYHASVRVRLERGTVEKDEQKNSQTFGEAMGVHTRAKVIKNRLGPPLRRCEFDIHFDTGIDDVGSWFGRLHEYGEIVKADGWCYLPSLPSGVIEDKGVNKGKDRGLKFREKQWASFVESKPTIEVPDEKTGELKPVTHDVKAHVLELIDRHMVVKYGQKPKDQEIDPESLMDVESVMEIVQNGQ